MEAQMVLPRQLETLAATCVGAAMLAAAVPAVASAALVGSENGITLTAGSQTQSHFFYQPSPALTSVPTVTFSDLSRTPTTIHGENWLSCLKFPTASYVNLSMNYTHGGYLTWLPSLACPGGTIPVEDKQTAYAEAIVRLPNGEVNYIETGDIVFDNMSSLWGFPLQ
jgi:hypothetical protein